MQSEPLTRLRNAFAQAALAWLAAPAPAGSVGASALPFSSMTETDWRAAVTLWRDRGAGLLDDLQPRPCPACGEERSRFLFFSYDAHPFHECAGCGCWFEPKVVDASLFNRFFQRCPEAGQLAERMMEARDQPAGRDADLARLGGYLDELLPLLPRSGSASRAYLDTGCGVGHSLRAGQLRGLIVQGVEADRTAVALARAAGLPVAHPDDAIPTGPYHLLSFWETLEHLADPLQALTRFLPNLADDGLVAITVPNLNALATRTLREACAWVHGGYNTPGHVNLFHPAALARLFARAGLTLLDVDGRFSGNPVELAGYVSGTTRGAFDALEASSSEGGVSSSLADALAAVWPGAALVERLGLASPIVFAIACKTGHEAVFAPSVAKRRASRTREIEGRARALIADEPDYKAMTADLQTETDRRDQLLASTHERLQDEIARRDQLLASTQERLQDEIARRDQLLASTQERLQDEIAGRDQLLASTQERLQDEIARRDDLLDRTQQTANNLQSQLAEAQRQMNLRDDLLQNVQQQLDATADRRIRTVLQAIHRRLPGGRPRS